MDLNGDGLFTITDVKILITTIYFFPGNFMIASIAEAPGIAQFFELQPAREYFNGFAAGALSAGFWLFVIFVLIGLIAGVVEFAAAVRENTRRALRATRQWITSGWRK